MRRISSWFYLLLPLVPPGAGRPHRLGDQELRAVRAKERTAVWCSACIGGMGVVLLYLPQRLMPDWFPETTLRLLGHDIRYSLPFLAYTVALVMLELLLLTLLHIWCAHAIAGAMGFIDKTSRADPGKMGLLLDIGLERRNKQVLQYGIDPLHGVNRVVLLAWTALFLLKASISNILFRFLVQRMMGRQLVAALQDFVGIPVFAFWNAFGTRAVLRETRVILFGKGVVDDFMQRLERVPVRHALDTLLVADTIQYVAVCKRDFHLNHYVLSRRLFEFLKIGERSGAWEERLHLERVQALDAPHREMHVLLITLGIILDGNYSAREQMRVRRLRRLGLMPHSEHQLRAWARDMVEGRGVDALLRAHLSSA
jgi:hypothetical protein